MDAIRTATLADAEELAFLVTELGYPSTAQRTGGFLATLLVDDGCDVLVFDCEGHLAGCVLVGERRSLTSESCAEVMGLVTHSAYRKRGVGRALMRAAEDWAASRGLRKLRLRTNLVRSDAHAFYKRIGYSAVKEQRVYEREL
jgi:GNAT superfamily N-acetyltransferase